MKMIVITIIIMMMITMIIIIAMIMMMMMMMMMIIIINDDDNDNIISDTNSISVAHFPVRQAQLRRTTTNVNMLKKCLKKKQQQKAIGYLEINGSGFDPSLTYPAIRTVRPPHSAPPTNYGLLSKLQLEWAAQLTDQEKGDYLSTYALSYQPSLPEHRVRTRYAVPAAESSKLHPVNNTCSNLLLRNTRLLKCPEMMPAVMTSVSV